MRWLSLCLLLMIVVPVATAQEATPTPATQQTIQVWWPDALYPANDEDTGGVLSAQFEEFNETYSQIEAVFRLKPSEGEGSALTTMLAGSEIAPTAMPQLTLLSRRDMVVAARNGLLQPLDAWLPDEMRETLLPNVLRLGEVDGELYGFPYSLTLTHLVYRTSLNHDDPLTYENILNNAEVFLLPGGTRPSTQVSDVVLAQYLAEGGRLVDGNNVAVLDENALLSLLQFYENGLEAGVFTRAIGDYDTPQSYWSDFVAGEAPLAVIQSTLLLQQSQPLPQLTLTPIPTQDGDTLTLLDGWMWVLVSPDPAEQDAALTLLRWLTEVENQSEYAAALGVLPASRPALRIWEDNPYSDLAPEWLRTSIILPVEQRNSVAAIQLQAAFEAVLNGETAEAATRTALANLGN